MVKKVTKRTPKAQKLRCVEGEEVEEIVRLDLEKLLPGCYIVQKRGQEGGVDIFLINGKILECEVKSALRYRWARTRVKGGYEYRSVINTFTIKPEDYQVADFFAFVIKEVDDNLDWDRTQPIKIHYIDTDVLIEHIKHKKAYKLKKQVYLNVKMAELMEPLDPRTKAFCDGV